MGFSVSKGSETKLGRGRQCSSFVIHSAHPRRRGGRIYSDLAGPVTTGLAMDLYCGVSPSRSRTSDGQYSAARRAHAQSQEHRSRYPAGPLVVITGLSGSGKSSLAFDTLYAEGQRRYVESLSTYARQFLSMMEKPDIDHVEGLSPAISIEQKSTSHNPRSTVGNDHGNLRLPAPAVRPRRHAALPGARPPAAGADRQPDGGRGAGAAGGQQADAARAGGARPQGRTPACVRGAARCRLRARPRRRHVRDLDDLPSLDKKKKHTIEVVVDRFKVREDIGLRLAESFETALA
jgi:excinuclease ABC subunit A